MTAARSLPDAQGAADLLGDDCPAGIIDAPTIPVAFICKNLLYFYLLSRIVCAGGFLFCVR